MLTAFSAQQRVLAVENLDTLDGVAQLFYENEIAAFDRYNGVYVQVNGSVDRIDSRKDLLVVRSGRFGLVCYYAKRDHSNLVLLRKAGKASVQGALSLKVSKSGDPIFIIDKCRVMGPYSRDLRDMSPKPLTKGQLEQMRFKKILDNL